MIKSEKSSKLLGVHTEVRLNFNYYTQKFRKKASKKLHKYMDVNERRLHMKSFLTSQFSFCPLIWIFNNSIMENRVRIHKRALRLVYDDSRNLSFEVLLVKYNSVSIHQKYLQKSRYRNLATEIFKAKQRDFTKNNLRFILFCKETIQL